MNQDQADALSDDAQKVLLCIHDLDAGGHYTGSHNVAQVLGWTTLRVAEAILELVHAGLIAQDVIS